jgi:uncharacterized membrane protein YbhN (UPF0104 family)
MEKFKTRNIWFVILMGAAIFAVFTNEIGFEKFIVLISNVNKPLILLAVFFNMLNLITFTITWRFLTPDINLYKLFKFDIKDQIAPLF